MKKIHVDGINGYLEANNKYVLVAIGKKDGSMVKEHVVLYDEIEDIMYKKPTREKYGFLILYLSTKSYITNGKIKYSLILDRIDIKDLESNKKLYDLIKNIVKNKKVEVQEVIENKEEKQEEKEDEKEYQVEETKEKNIIAGVVIIDETEKKERIVEKKEIINEVTHNNDSIINEVVEIKEDKKQDELKAIPKDLNEKANEIEIIIDSISNNEEQEQTEEVKEATEEIKEDLEKGYDIKEVQLDEVIKEEQEIKEEQPKEKEKIIEEQDELDIDDEEEIEEELDNNYKSEEEKEVKETHFKTINELESKIKGIEKELIKLEYKELIINNYIDESLDRKKIEKYIIELKKVLEKLEKIKKEVNKQEKKISENDIIKIEDGNVIITKIGRLSLDDKKQELENYLDYYKRVINRMDSIEKESDDISKNADYKKDKLKITEEEYEKCINDFKNVKSNKELIKNYLYETKEDLKKVKKKIEKTINPKVKYKYVKRSISEQTKRLATLTALNSLRPGRSRASMVALSLLTGVSSISDLLGYDLKKVEYNEVIIKEMIIGLDSLDTSKARLLIDTSKEQIDSILRDCDRMYIEYPKYKELRNELLSVKNDIEKEDEELRKMEKQIIEYNLDSKVKILKYQE